MAKKPSTKSQIASPHRLATDRFLREGRWDQWQAELKKAEEAEPPVESNDLAAKMKRGTRIKMEALLAMGYKGPEHEKALERERKRAMEHEVAMSPAGPAVASKSFDDALKDLPNSADPDVEHEWIMAHARIAKKSRMDDQSKRILITGDDLLKADHGICPSRSAANKLQYWANEQDDVFKNQAGLMKKKDGREHGKGTDVVEDVELEEVKRLLKQVRNG